MKTVCHPRQLPLAGLLLLAATAVPAVAIATGSATGFASRSTTDTTTLRLIATIKDFTSTTPSGRDLAATHIWTFTDVLRTTDGKRAGRDNCFCVAVDADHLVCTGVLTLRQGSLTFTQPFRNSTQRGTGTITGGTGRYLGASGTFTATGIKGTEKFQYTIRLRQADDDGFTLPDPDGVDVG